MPSRSPGPLLGPFLATAERVARARPEVDLAGDPHDRGAVAAAYLVSAAVLQL